MSKIFHSDISSLAFKPIIDLSDSSFGTLSSKAATHLLDSHLTNNQWGAFMHFYGPTRKLLKLGGLDLELEDFTCISSSNSTWNCLVENYKNKTLGPNDQIFLARTLYYMGFYEAGIELCRQTAVSTDDKGALYWSKYLITLGESLINPVNWSATQWIEEVKAVDRSFPFLGFHINMLIAKFFIRNSFDCNISTYYLDKALDCSKFFEKADRTLAKLRCDKYQADLYLRTSDNKTAIKLLEISCSSADEAINDSSTNPYWEYLFKEVKRRITDTLFRLHLETEDFVTAYKYAQESVRLDPYCSRAHMFAGKSALHFDKDRSKFHFEKSAKYGVIERSYANQELLKIHVCHSLISKELEIESSDIKVFAPGNFPDDVQKLEPISKKCPASALWNLSTGSEVYQLTLPFWELTTKDNDIPIFCQAPLKALSVFDQNQEPWFETLYFQRAMPVNFREELIYAISPHATFATENLSLAIEPKILENRSAATDLLLAKHKEINSLKGLKRTFFCRLLGSLGFYKEAIDGLIIPDQNSAWNFEEEYAFCTKLFFDHISLVDASPTFNTTLEFAFQKVSAHPNSLRMKLILAITACVYHGKTMQIDFLKEWRQRAYQTLESFQNCDLFNDFEKQLITSRYYRAVSFYPYLINDKDTLYEEANHCERLARSLIPLNHDHALLKRENLMPMLETVSRIHDHLGNHKKALCLMEEIVEKVDPLDAKAWLQVGQVREKGGDLKEALKAYENAVSLGVPLGAISCYKAGRASEKLLLVNEAIHYYLESLKFCPRGISPLKRINAISKNANDRYLEKWSEDNLNNLLKITSSH